MKRKLVFVISFLLILTSCSTTFDGYSYSIESARKGDAFYGKYYDAYDYIFTVEQEKYVFDFLICGDSLRILKFDCKERNGKMLYQIKSESTFLISESLPQPGVQKEPEWIKTGKFPFQIEFLITTGEKSSDGFDFTYNDIEYVLLYRILE